LPVFKAFVISNADRSVSHINLSIIYDGFLRGLSITNILHFAVHFIALVQYNIKKADCACAGVGSWAGQPRLRPAVRGLFILDFCGVARSLRQRCRGSQPFIFSFYIKMNINIKNFL